MSTRSGRPFWLFMTVGLFLYASMFLLTDFVLHGAKWSHGQAHHRFYAMLPSALITGVFFELTTS